MFLSLLAAVNPEDAAGLIAMIQDALTGGKLAIAAVAGLVLAVLVLRQVVAPRFPKVGAFLLHPVVTVALPALLSVAVTALTALVEGNFSWQLLVASVLSALWANAAYDAGKAVVKAFKA
jgi:hypothetical protein